MGNLIHCQALFDTLLYVAYHHLTNQPIITIVIVEMVLVSEIVNVNA